MPRVIVNGTVEQADHAPKHWGELLSVVEAAVARRGRLVTAVRFDGVEESAFREPDVLGRTLAPDAIVEIEAVDRTELVREVVSGAVQSAEDLACNAERVAEGFRGYGIKDANAELTLLAQGLGTMVAILRALSDVTGIEPSALETRGGGSAGHLLAELTGFIDTLIEARSSSDWITVADIIEYDVVPHLRRWPAVFEAFADRASASRPC